MKKIKFLNNKTEKYIKQTVENERGKNKMKKKRNKQKNNRDQKDLCGLTQMSEQLRVT